MEITAHPELSVDTPEWPLDTRTYLPLTRLSHSTLRIWHEISHLHLHFHLWAGSMDLYSPQLRLALMAAAIGAPPPHKPRHSRQLPDEVSVPRHSRTVRYWCA